MLLNIYFYFFKISAGTREYLWILKNYADTHITDIQHTRKSYYLYPTRPVDIPTYNSNKINKYNQKIILS